MILSRKKRTKFVVLTYPRSGSNYLCSLLNSHRDVLCHHELFGNKDIFYAISHKDKINFGSVQDRDADQERFLKKIWEKNFGSTHVGFKMLPGQGMNVIEEILTDRTIKKIFIKRSNILRMYLSICLARISNRWGTQKKHDWLEYVPIKIEYDEFISFVKTVNQGYRQWENKLRDAKQEYLIVHYPDIIHYSEVSKILQFLNLDDLYHLMSTNHKRQGDYELHEIIHNFDEFKSKLFKSGHEKFLNPESI